MMRRKRLIVLVASSLLASGLPLLVGAQEGDDAVQAPPEGVPVVEAGICIAPEARTNIAECPTGSSQVRSQGGGVRSVEQDPESHFRATKRDRPEPTNTGPTGPSVEITEAQRRNLNEIQVRALGLLQREVTVLERLVGRMRGNDPRGAEYLLSLAEAYFELQQVYNRRARELDEPIFQARSSKNQGRLQQLQQQQRDAEDRLQNYRQEAIRTYARLVRDYPNYPEMDRVLFSARLRPRGDAPVPAGASGVPPPDQELSRRAQYIPNAYLSPSPNTTSTTGDMRRRQSVLHEGDGDPARARNPVYGYALYKTGVGALQHRGLTRALCRQFVQRRRVRGSRIQTPETCAQPRASQSRRELVSALLARRQTESSARVLPTICRRTEDQAREMLENRSPSSTTTPVSGPKPSRSTTA